ncbi:endonuclease domain-containing protein [Corynebacterium liangguodongii]|uniref:endonuclease domain-containing protein n=1 Tax=Corynebacterium liangguodongii TaxID=2079535 RepID=UPI001F310816|nr:DUF559 domain-containing protein [Corynebacterium liangguodongii]
MLDTRRLTKSDGQIRKDIADGKYEFLAPTQVVAKEHVRRLAPWHAFFLRAFAVGRSMRTGVVVSRAAAALRGMWVIGAHDLPVEVALPSGGTPSRRKRMPNVRYREATFRRDEIEVIHGVRTTSVIRTFIDIARYHGFPDGLVAADWLLSQAGTSYANIQAEIDRMGRFVGKKRVIECVKWASNRADSPHESRFRAHLIERGIGGWTFQPAIGRFRPDFLFDDFLIVEIDGRSKYTEKTAEVLMRERDRERELINQGYVFLRFYPQEIAADIDAVLAQIAQARNARGRGRGSG